MGVMYGVELLLLLVRVEICVGDGVFASWCGDGFPSWGGQVRVLKLGCSSGVVQVGVLWISLFPILIE
jgi:hypothetical protein